MRTAWATRRCSPGEASQVMDDKETEEGSGPRNIRRKDVHRRLAGHALRGARRKLGGAAAPIEPQQPGTPAAYRTRGNSRCSSEARRLLLNLSGPALPLHIGHAAAPAAARRFQLQLGGAAAPGGPSRHGGIPTESRGKTVTGDKAPRITSAAAVPIHCHRSGSCVSTLGIPYLHQLGIGHAAEDLCCLLHLKTAVAAVCCLLRRYHQMNRKSTVLGMSNIPY